METKSLNEAVIKSIDKNIREWFHCIKQLDNYPSDPSLIESVFEAEKKYKLARSIYINAKMGPANLFPGSIWENPQSKEDFEKRMIYLKQMETLNLFGAYHNSN